MTNKTRKRFVPVALVMALAAIGVVALTIALAGGSPQSVQAHGDSPGSCDSEASRALHNLITPSDPCPTNNAPMAVGTIPEQTVPDGSSKTMDVSTYFSDADGDALTYGATSSDTAVATVSVSGSMVTIMAVAAGSATITVMANDGTADSDAQTIMVTVPAVNLTAPTKVMVAALDNSMTVRWSAPTGYDPKAKLTGYKITPTLYVQDANNPISNTTLLPKTVGAHATETYFWGLSYSTYYTYTVAAMYTYDDAAGNPIMKMVAAAPVTMRTADSGGILYPAETPPGKTMGLTATPRLSDAQICQPLTAEDIVAPVVLSWTAPSDAGKGAPQQLDDDDCGTCSNRTSPHTGGDNAGITLLGEDAEIVGYTVERRVAGGGWGMLATVSGTMYIDVGVMSGVTYEYQVSAMNSVGLSGAWSDIGEIDVESAPEPPGRPSSLVATVKEPVSPDLIQDVELQWDPPLGPWRTAEDDDGGVDGVSETVAYCVQRSVSPNQWNTLPSEGMVHLHLYSDEGPATTVLTQEYTDGDAPAGGVTYRVAAVFVRVTLDDPATEEDESDVAPLSGPSLWNQANEVKTASYTEPPGPLGNVTALTCAPAAGAGSVTCAWNAGDNANIHWVAAAALDSTGEFDFSKRVWTEADSDTSHTETGLESGTQYLFLVISGRRADGSEEWGTWARTSVTPN